jgi:hypothetical protein
LRRAQAVELLSETANEARGLEDLFYRARVQALAGDALWPFDEARARQIFRRAWDAAEASDKAEQEELASLSGSGSTPPMSQFTEARREVLTRAAVRDRSLANLFLDRLKAERESEQGQSNAPSAQRPFRREPSANSLRRLSLALELLDEEQAQQAYEVAMPAVEEGVSDLLVLFMLRLSERNPSAADRLYRAALERTGNDPGANANDVLLLSTPVISPELLIVFDSYGSLQLRPIAPNRTSVKAPASLSQSSRMGFYQLAASILLRPFAARSETGLRPEAPALFYTLERLLPFFEREAAPYAPELRARLQTLAGELEAPRREQLTAQAGLNRLTPENEGDPLGPQLEQLARAGKSSDRDRIRLALTKTAARKRLWERARRIATEIEAEGSRRAALSFIAISQIADIPRAHTEDREDDFESMVKFLINVDAPAFARAWGLALVAEIAAQKKERARGLELLQEAERQAELVQQGTRQRAAVYAVLTASASRFDAARAWEMLALTVKAANAIEDYTGEEVELDLTADEESSKESSEETPEPFIIETAMFRLDKIFATMAHLDFEKALTNARALSGPVPRALASIAVARTMLEQDRGRK